MTHFYYNNNGSGPFAIMNSYASKSSLPVQKRVSLRDVEIQALELAALGWTQERIAEAIGRTRSGVSKMLHRTEQKLVLLLKDRGEQIKARQTMSLETIYREAMQAWQDSKEDAESLKSVESQNGDRSELTVQGRIGDPRFLDQARGAMADIRKIWGLDETGNSSPQSGTTSNFSSNNMQVILNDEHTRQSLCDLAAGLAKSLGQSGDAGQPGDDIVEGQVETPPSS